VKVVNVFGDLPAPPCRNADASCRSHREASSRSCVFEKVQTYSKPAFTAMPVTFKEFDPAKGVPDLFYALAQKTRLTCRASLPQCFWSDRHDDFVRGDPYMMTVTPIRALEEPRGMRSAALELGMAPRVMNKSISNGGESHFVDLPPWQTGPAHVGECSLLRT